jgi:CubicO group peptidase (beta-lactamase class C family)
MVRRLMGIYPSSRKASAAPWGAACWGIVALAAACGAPGRQLHPFSGDEFGVFAPGAGTPPPIRCAGTLEERFACVRGELEQKAREVDVGGAFALSMPDGQIRAAAQTDTLNARASLTEETRWAAASVSKMFLAAAAVSLKEEGALDLQQPIAAYLPELAGDGGVGRATLHQLLTHTSGLGNPEQCTTPDDDLPGLIERYGKQRLLAPPGAVFNYSNVGYSFVALVLERVAGKPFEDVVRERVTTVAGIPGASYGFEPRVIRGHGPDVIPRRCRALWPSGGLMLSVRELARWANELAHPGNSRLGRPLIELLTAPHVPTDDRPGAAYGYGVKRIEHDGVTIFSHAGRLEDATAIVAWSPERQIGVAAFANTSQPLLFPAAFRALSTFLALSPDWAPPPGPAHPLSAYAGLYVDDAGTLGRVRFSIEDDALVLDYLDGPPPLLPATFSFHFDTGTLHPRYVVTPVGVGERRGD